ncbi:DUF4136 domain-containing protein [Spongiivirga citrea]|uniref:DUF4136 domain-containing protein n=1 Tax=Spongiivirga citrea TaxID=1481457 RepID=A0A6M0CRL7_9FLAO|nr:DUF4136 domain-containing protein [Spongiivirga citrea]NER18724.1 DUF4136 domain-containing protein [Spongiivirga citrea]
MKKIKVLLPLLLVLMLTSCVSVRVASDYDQQANFNEYKSFAFYKTGIDKAEISDLDKKRILRAIESEMLAKGFVKSDNPDVLVNIFTKEKERVDVYNNWGWGGFGWGGFGWGGWGWGWGPGWGGGLNNISTRTEGSLYIDVIDTDEKELVWQGKGTGNLVTNNNIEKKEARIREFVQEIMKQYPPLAQAN